MAKLKGLGRGMDAVFDDNSLTPRTGNGATMLRISDVEPRKNQPRKVFREAGLAELASSIEQNGVIQPIVVRDAHNGFYSIIAGERRWRAAKIAGLTEIPVVILDVDDARAAQLALIENVQREDLSPLETAQAYRLLMDEYGMTQEEVADKVGKSRPAVANTLGLLSLPDEVKDQLAAGNISEGHARALKGIKDPAKVRRAVAEVVTRGLSVRAAEALVRRVNQPPKKSPDADNTPAEGSPSVRVNYARDLEVRMTRALGRPVRIRKSGKVNKLILEYIDNDDLQTLVEKLCGKLED